MQLGDLSMCNDSAPLALQGRFGAQTWSDKLWAIAQTPAQPHSPNAQSFCFFWGQILWSSRTCTCISGGGQVGQIKLSAEGSVGDSMLWRRCVTPFAVVQKRRFAATFCPLLEQLGDIVVELLSSLITISLTTFFPFSHFPNNRFKGGSILMKMNLCYKQWQNETSPQHVFLFVFLLRSCYNFPVPLRQDIIRMRQSIEERKRVYKEGRNLPRRIADSLNVRGCRNRTRIIFFSTIWLYEINAVLISVVFL